MKRFFALVVALALLLGAFHISASSPPLEYQVGFDSITTGEIDDSINYLASPDLKGRRADTPESAIVAEFLADNLEANGFAPIDEDFYQEFCLFEDVVVTDRDIRIWEYFMANGWNTPECATNVAGIYPGTTRADEYIVLVAHRDHTGINPSRVATDHPHDDPNGHLLNLGADDNASGTAALIELAEAVNALADAGMPLQRSIIVLFADAEEFGLWGSRYFVQHAPVPLEDIVAVVNLDMLGRNAPTYLRVIGAPEPSEFEERNPDLAKITLAAAERLGFAITYPPNEGASQDVFQRSDHFSFYDASPVDNRIPVVFLSGGLHEDYHRPSDTAEKINDAKVRDITRLALMIVWEVSETDSRPDFIETR